MYASPRDPPAVTPIRSRRCWSSATAWMRGPYGRVADPGHGGPLPNVCTTLALLWRLLGAGQRGDDVARELWSLARLPLPQRVAFLADAVELARADDANVRAAAVTALAGCRGILGVGAIVAALDDDEAQVRAQAVDALRSTACEAPMRWVHAIFHPRPDVRARALEDLPPRAAHLGVYLRVDPANAGRARAAPWGERSIPLALDLFARGAADPDEVAGILSSVAIEDLRTLLRRGDRRSDADVEAFLRATAAEPEPPPPPHRDLVDTWLEIADRSTRGPALYALLGDVAAPHDERALRRRVLTALLVRARARPWTADAAELAVACDVEFLLMPGVPPDVRRRATEALWACKGRLDAVSHDLVEEVLLSEVIGSPPDVRAAIAVVSLRSHRWVRTLVDHFGESRLVELVSEDRIIARDVFRLPAEASAQWLLHAVERRFPERYARTCATALAHWVTSAPALFGSTLEGLDAETACAVLRAPIAGEADVGVETGRRLVAALAPRVSLQGHASLLGELLPRIGETELVLALVRVVLERFETRALALLVLALPVGVGGLFTRLIEERAMLAPEPLHALATALAHHPDPGVGRFAARIIRAARARGSGVRPPIHAVRNLTEAERNRIATCEFEALDDALAPALEAPARGLCEALARRPDPDRPHLAACVALVACIDGLEAVTRELDRFGSSEASFQDDLHCAVTTMWRGQELVPPLVDAWLAAWDAHAEAFATWVDAEEGGLLGVLERSLDLHCGWVRHRLWQAASSLVSLLRFRNTSHLRRMVGPSFVRTLVRYLDTELGPPAARMLAALYRAGVQRSELPVFEARVWVKAPDLSTTTRFELGPWLTLGGFPPRDRPARALPPPSAPSDIARIRSAENVEWLGTVCASGRHVHEAVLRLVELGDDGGRKLLDLLAGDPSSSVRDAVFESISLWTSEACLTQIRRWADEHGLPPEARFRLGLGLLERGEVERLPSLLALLSEPIAEGDSPSWLRTRDYDALVRAAGGPAAVAPVLVTSPHPAAYTRAVEWLLEQPVGDPAANAALGAFLELGTDRHPALREAAARRLLAANDFTGLPLLVSPWCAPERTERDWTILGAPEPGLTRFTRAVIMGALVGGSAVCTERRALELLERVPHELAEPWLEQLLTHGVDDATRQVLVSRRRPTPGRTKKLQEIAEVFAWGIRRGLELTGRRCSIHMTGKRDDYGHTPLDQRRIFVTPLPLLVGDRHGRHIVEALVLHELGHHMYHRGKAAARVWRRARKAGLFHLLNLVADEHLERNLRALDPEFGDRIERLDAYAFQHAAREMQVERLLHMLRGAAFEVLTRVRLDVAYVRVDGGRLLLEIARCDNPFARFVRALRMGLGDRDGDPRVEAGLALFKGGFRHLDMTGLWKITVHLSRIYGSDATLAMGFGGHEGIEWDERDATIHGEGIEDEEIQREVERIFDAPQGSPSLRERGPGRLQINVGHDQGYNPIRDVVPLTPDRDEHRRRAHEVRRHAERLRDVLRHLGLAMHVRRGRLRGRVFDRTRTRAVVTRRDPRMLLARELEVRSDLFIGVVIDCSGSMTGIGIERARQFGVLIAEAARGLAGVDARFFGFTDAKIFDAGDAERCAVSSLAPEGGNNDAAGLEHAARVAMASRRRAKLLVMISDGLPTECSVDALRNLVQRLGRRHGMCCAQIAVRPLEEVCFPHYVVVDDEDMGAAVRRFGEITGRLVGRALGR